MPDPTPLESLDSGVPELDRAPARARGQGEGEVRAEEIPKLAAQHVARATVVTGSGSLVTA